MSVAANALKIGDRVCHKKFISFGIVEAISKSGNSAKVSWYDAKHNYLRSAYHRLESLEKVGG